MNDTKNNIQIFDRHIKSRVNNLILFTKAVLVLLYSALKSAFSSLLMLE